MTVSGHFGVGHQGRDILIVTQRASLFSREHATLQSTMSVGRSVCRSVGRLVGWSVASRFGSKAFIQRSADDRERLAKDEKEKQKALLQDSDLVAKRRKSSLREDEDKEEGDELKKDDKEEKEDKE